jgi:hypothetical protein
MKKTERHPTLEHIISFDPVPHTYTDNFGTRYESVTSLVKRFFPPFDEQAAAARIAAKTNRLEMDILREWHTKRDDASGYGTRVHEYAEAQILARSQSSDVVSPPVPENERERRAFGIVDKAIDGLAKKYEFYVPEQIVFDPLYQLAGMIDLPARNLKTGALAILDWKTCESITSDSYGKTALPPIEHVPDSKLAKYQMQLSVYAWLLTSPYSAYSSRGYGVELALIHIPQIGFDPVWRPVHYDGDAAEKIVQSRTWDETVENLKSRSRSFTRP